MDAFQTLVPPFFGGGEAIEGGILSLEGKKKECQRQGDMLDYWIRFLVL